MCFAGAKIERGTPPLTNDIGRDIESDIEKVWHNSPNTELTLMCAPQDPRVQHLLHIKQVEIEQLKAQVLALQAQLGTPSDLTS